MRLAFRDRSSPPMPSPPSSSTCSRTTTSYSCRVRSASAKSSGDEVSVIFAVVGHGTEQLAGLQAGDTVDDARPARPRLQPQGRRQLHSCRRRTRRALANLRRAKLAEHDASFATAVFGYRNDHFAEEYVSRYADWSWSIDDAEGNVVDLLNKLEQGDDLKALRSQADHFLSCGPLPMMKAVADWAAERGIPAQLSMEQRMGCGYGTCVLCTIDTVDGRLKVCSDGPVFTREQLGWGSDDEAQTTSPRRAATTTSTCMSPVWKHHTKGGRSGMEESGRHRLRHLPVRRRPLVLRRQPARRRMHQGRLALTRGKAIPRRAPPNRRPRTSTPWACRIPASTITWPRTCPSSRPRARSSSQCRRTLR